MIRFRLCAALIPLLGLPNTLAAQAPADKPKAEAEGIDELMALLDTPIESASKRVQKSTESPQAVQVLTGDQIRASGAFRLHDLLKLMTGVQVWEIDYEFSRVALRGVAPNGGPRTIQILLDGVPLYNANSGVVDVDNLPIPIDAIERVEVVRGPSSSLYGANAQLGVISIVSKRGKDGASGSLREGANRWHTSRAQGYFSYGAPKFNVTAALGIQSLRDSGQLQRVTNGTRTVDQQDQTHGSELFIRPEAVFGEARIWGLYGAASKLSGPQVIENSAGVKTSQFAHQKNVNTIAQAGWSQAWTPTLRSELKVNHAHEVYNLGYLSRIPGSALSNGVVTLLLSLDPALAGDYDILDYTLDQTALQVNWDPSPTLHFVFGGDHSTITGGKAPILGLAAERKESASGGFGSMDWNLSRFTVSLGARIENESLGGSRTSPRGALVYSLDETNTFRLGYFTSSRSPQIGDVYAQLNVPGRPVAIPNQSLKPEEAENLEFGYRKTFAKWSFDLTLFRMTLKKLISSQPTGQVSGGQPVVQNRNGSSDLTDQGVEATLTGELAPGWLLGLNAATADFHDDSVGGQGDYAPKATANLWTRYKRGIFQLYVAFQYLDSYYRRNLANPSGPRELADDTLQTHFNVGIEPWKGVSFSAYGINAGGTESTVGSGLNNVHLVRYARRELGLQASYRF